MMHVFVVMVYLYGDIFMMLCFIHVYLLRTSVLFMYLLPYLFIH